MPANHCVLSLMEKVGKVSRKAEDDGMVEEGYCLEENTRNGRLEDTSESREIRLLVT